MRLYLMRHATAVVPGTPGCPDEEHRPLTTEGEIEAVAVAEGLKRLAIAPALIVTSALARAIETAERVARVLQRPMAPTPLEALRSEADPRATSLALRAFAQHEQLLLVGHEPHLSAWMAELVAGDGGMRCRMRQAGVACIEIERVPPPSGSGVLHWVMSAGQLTMIGRAQ